MKTSIYWFSGTGNTLALAKQLRDALDDARLIPLAAQMPPQADAADSVVVAFPVYYFTVPRIVAEFLEKIQLQDNTKIYLLATMGGQAGRSHHAARKILATRGIDVCGGWSIAMPGNYTPIHGAPPEEKQRAMFAAAKKRIPAIARQISEGSTVPLEDSAAPMRAIGKLIPLMMKDVGREDRKFHVDESCVHCGLCAKTCPVNNIIMEEGTPKWQHHCEQCMACMQFCPPEAIQLGKRTSERERYHHPDVNPGDIASQRRRKMHQQNNTSEEA